MAMQHAMASDAIDFKDTDHYYINNTLSPLTYRIFYKIKNKLINQIRPLIIFTFKHFTINRPSHME